MSNYFCDENNGLWYRENQDYYIPCLTAPENISIGIYARKHLQFLQEHRRVTYINLLTSGKLNSYLADIDKQAKERFELLISQMKKGQGITEQLKADNQLEWVRQMNRIRHKAEEIILAELIYH